MVKPAGRLPPPQWAKTHKTPRNIRVGKGKMEGLWQGWCTALHVGRVNSGPQKVFLAMVAVEGVPGSTDLASLIHRSNCTLPSCPCKVLHSGRHG